MKEIDSNSQLEKYRPANIPVRLYFPRFVIYSTIILFTSTLIGIAAFRTHTEIELNKESTRSTSAIALAASLARHDFETVTADLSILANDDTISDYLKYESPGNSIERIENEFVNLSRTRRLYDQIRLIDPLGNELVRVNYSGDETKVVTPEKLQNKFHRDYFIEISRLDKGEIYISRLDLNIENGKVEIPYKPTIRFGAPLHDASGTFRGAIVLNFFGGIFIDQFKKQMALVPGTGMLINSDGFWLSGPNPEDEWAFMLGGKANFGQQYPNAWATINAEQTGTVDTSIGKYLFTTVHPFSRINQANDSSKQLNDWKIISFLHVEARSLSSILDHVIEILPLMAMLPIVLFIGWYLARAAIGRNMVEQELARSYLMLEKEVDTRTRDLQSALTNSARAHESLAQNEEKLRSIVDSSNVTAIVSIDDEGKLITWNPGAEAAFGYSKDEILDQPLVTLIPERYRNAHEEGLKRASKTGKYNVLGKTVELAGLHKDGYEFPLELALGVWEDSKRRFFSAIINDISERKKAEDRIRELAFTDIQTGMPNEVSFLEHLNATLDQNRQGFVASIELSGIGDIVGMFGLEASGLIFYELGRRLSSQMNDLSIAARVGQRSFKITYLANGIEEEALKQVTTRIFKITQQPFDLMGSEISVSVYMGVRFYGIEETSAKPILTDLEIAHYQAMQSASSCIVYFSNAIKEELVRSAQIVSWLHPAIENSVFKLFFQPQIELKTNTIVGCEALIRWPFGAEEWISPGEFIPIAEKTGLIRDITKWTVEEACRTAASWDKELALNVKIGVNISAEELASPNFLDYMSRFIERSKLPTNALEIEITETALMKDVDVASKNLKKLRDMGVSVAIDDFGTGQASLAYLKAFPIDRLKIDQSFLQGALTNKTDREIIESVIKLAHSLGMDVIAEGAEEKEHIDLLVSLGCDEVQGYFVAKPMPADQFLEFVKTYS